MFILQGVDENYNTERAVPLNFQVTTVPLAKDERDENIQRLIAK
jgi:hypothetical protein